LFGVYASSDVSKVVARADGARSGESKPAIVSKRVEGELNAALGDGEGFGVFAIAVRGCKMERSLRIVARNDKGEVWRIATGSPGMMPVCD
jgi:hypothetical protein